MLKHGVFDYVLKPVKRETIEDLLVSWRHAAKNAC